MSAKYFAEAIGVMAVLASPCLVGVAFVYVAAFKRRKERTR